jgi:hypothetical protein
MNSLRAQPWALNAAAVSAAPTRAARPADRMRATWGRGPRAPDDAAGSGSAFNGHLWKLDPQVVREAVAPIRQPAQNVHDLVTGTGRSIEDLAAGERTVTERVPDAFDDLSSRGW